MKQLLLVRHGQASFGTDDYDALSEIGHEQGVELGRALAARGVNPDLVVRGGMRRHEQTADALLRGWARPVPVQIDRGWDEFDFQHVVDVFNPAYRDREFMRADLARGGQPRQRFQEIFEQATARWATGEHASEYDESFAAFAARVVGALESAAGLSPDRGTVLVVTSGGPIGAVVSQLLAGDMSLWPQLNRVTVNTSVTKVLNGRAGLTLSVFNAHEHLEADPRLLTYR